jgi:serine/threonine protein kinase
MPRTGDKIGPYTLINKLGSGAFGSVWLAEKRTSITTTRVALKTPLDSDVDLETIKQEADLWVQVSGHPNVLPIIEADVYDGQVVIVSEYAPGGTLGDRLSQLQGKMMPVDVAGEMILSVLAGLEHLHQKNVIHRDLKPANILLQGDIPRLADFGISRILKSTRQSNNIAGTPVYMAPEAFYGKRSVQTDIWSVGVIFYELLSGHLPYPQSDIGSLVVAILNNNPPPLPTSVPPVIQEVVTNALQKDPAMRYKSAAEMRRALRNAMQIVQRGKRIPGRSTEVIPDLPPPAPPAAPSQEHVKHGIAPHYVYSGTALIIVLMVGGMIALFMFRQSGNPINTVPGFQVTGTATPASSTPPPILPPSSEPRRSVQDFQRVESKILNGRLLSSSDLTGFSQYELKLFRNTIYARHGRVFQTPEVQNYFDGRPWYTRRDGYSDADLTPNDIANTKMIQKFENE